MQKINLDIPADTESVTLNLKQADGRPTLRNMLPTICSSVELVVCDVCDEFGRQDWDKIRLAAGDGKDLVKKLTRSRVLEGDTLLELVPTVRVREPRPRLVNGSSCIEGDSVVELYVAWPVPDEED